MKALCISLGILLNSQIKKHPVLEKNTVLIANIFIFYAIYWSLLCLKESMRAVFGNKRIHLNFVKDKGNEESDVHNASRMKQKLQKTLVKKGKKFAGAKKWVR